jgi:hypothetical protein
MLDERLKIKNYIFSFEFKNGNYPSYCDNEDVCQKVSSQLHAPINQHR